MSYLNHRWPLTYVLLLTASDDLDNGPSFLVSEYDVITVVKYPIVHANATLPLKRLWNIVLLAYGCRENVLTERAELSKTMEFV